MGFAPRIVSSAEVIGVTPTGGEYPWNWAFKWPYLSILWSSFGFLVMGDKDTQALQQALVQAKMGPKVIQFITGSMVSKSPPKKKRKARKC